PLRSCFDGRTANPVDGDPGCQDSAGYHESHHDPGARAREPPLLDLAGEIPTDLQPLSSPPDRLGQVHVLHREYREPERRIGPFHETTAEELDSPPDRLGQLYPAEVRHTQQDLVPLGDSRTADRDVVVAPREVRDQEHESQER